jgi:Fibronectin type III domain
MVQQPVGGTTGLALPTQPVVEVQDIYGNRVFNFAGNITASVGGTNATLTSASSSSLSASVVAGRATFTDLALTATPAVNYQLGFASGGLVGVNSTSIQVIPGAPVRIQVLNQPIGSQTGAELAGQPVVKIMDSFGNTVTQDNSTVITAAISAGSGGTLTRVVAGQPVAVTASVVNGVATFSHLVMRGLTSQSYQLTFSSGNLATDTSANFTVHHAAVVKLVWNSQPITGMTGSPLTRAAVLELQDMDGNLATTDNSTVVTAALTSGVGGSIVNTSATAVNGVVTFNNLTLTGTPGAAYKLTFTGAAGGTTVSAPESNPIVPTHAVPAKLRLVNSNVTGGLVGENLVGQPTLEVLDRFNNLATSDNATVVTAGILNDTTGSVLGNTTAQAVNGVVTFSGLKATGVPGTDYQLSLDGNWQGTALTGVTSNAFHMSKVADVTLSYATQAYVPDAIVPAVFNTDSPGAITFTTNSSSLICELDPGTGDLTIKGAGNCDVHVAVDTDPNGFYLGNSADARLVITKAQQAPVTITSASAVDYWSGLTPVATGGTGTGALTVNVVASSTCRLIGVTIMPGDAGSLCQITATRAGDNNYLPETSAVQTILVRKINQAPLAMASAASMTVDSLNLFTSGGSGSGAVTYSIVSAGTAHCAISGAVLSATAAGTCSVKATKAASTNYNVVVSPTQLIRVTKDVQAVAFTSTAPMNPIIGGSYLPTATASSGLAVTYSVATGSACEVDALVPGKINFTALGTCELVATQSGSARYAIASARQFIQVGALNQTIKFDMIPDLPFGTPAFKVAPTTNAGTNAVITLSTTSNSVSCSLVGDIVTLNSAGLCEMVAHQGGYGSYLAATDVVRSFNVLADQAGAPQIFSSSVATHSITASFTPPSYTGGSPITGYVLIATDANGVSYENAACGPLGVSPVTCTIVGIPNDIAYTAVARAITTAGRGAVSNATQAQTPIDAPLAVTNLTVATSSNNLVLNWTPPIAAQGLVTGYQVFVAPIGTDFSTTPSYTAAGATASSATIQNVLNQSTSAPSPGPSPTATIAPASYRISFRRASISSPSPTPNPSGNQGPSAATAGFQVRIVTVVGGNAIASNSNTTSGFQTNFAVPLSPSQLTLTPNGSDLVISWSPPTADGGSEVTGYDVKVNGTTVCSATTLLFCTYTGMAAGQTYDVSVTAINAVGTSAAALSSHSIPAPPAAPAPVPTASPTPTPTASPTGAPTIKPTPKPTPKPTTKPTPKPSASPSTSPSASPSAVPTSSPSPSASPSATESATPMPSDSPSTGAPGAGGSSGTPVLPGAPVANPAIGATGDDSAPSVPFNPMGSTESVKAVTQTTTKVAAIAASIAAAAAAAGAAAVGAAAAGAGAAAAGGAGVGSGTSGGSSSGGSIATIDATHEEYELRRRGRGDDLKLWRRRWLLLLDKLSIRATLITAPISPVLSRIMVDGAYLRAAFGTLAVLPTLASAGLSVIAVAINGTTVSTPIWQLFLAMSLVGIFDAFAGLVGTTIFVLGSFLVHVRSGSMFGLDDVRMMLGVIIVGFGPALLANTFRNFRKVPERGSFYLWERIVDLGVLPFIGGWVTSSMISTLPALAGMTLAVANHVNDFALAVAAAIVLRVIGEEAVARTFAGRLDYLHPTHVPPTPGFQRWISLGFRLFVFIFVTAALMGNHWQVWVGSALFVLPTMLGWWQEKLPNSKWVWRIMPQGIPGLALTLWIASITTSLVTGWLGTNPEAALWSFAILPIPMLALNLMSFIGREGDEGEVRWVRRGNFVWVYRIGGILLLLLTMKVAGVI